MGEEVVLEARIISVVDTVEAITAHRPYRPALGVDGALAEIEKARGELFDSSVVDACLDLIRNKEYKFKEQDYFAS